MQPPAQPSSLGRRECSGTAQEFPNICVCLPASPPNRTFGKVEPFFILNSQQSECCRLVPLSQQGRSPAPRVEEAVNSAARAGFRESLKDV